MALAVEPNVLTKNGPVLTNLVGKYISVDDILLDVPAADKAKIVSEIASFAARRHRMDQALIERALWRREQAGTTGIGFGVAIPHARIPGLSRPIALFVRTGKPVKFGAPDRKPVQNLFVILVPAYATDEHLRILGAVSALFADAAFRERLAGAVTPSEVYTLLSEWQVD